mmetsp:Transcript_49888/g.159596  ORF Transcript_49888/g.159596 Transcript_49888/m.159596 type:complete len:172 (+) Transcript_49888:669-1184(+)
MSSPVRRAKLLSEYGIPGVTHPSGEAPRTHNAVFVVPSASTMKKKIKPVKKKKRRTATTPTYVTKAESDAKIHLYQRTATDLRFVNAALAEEVQRSRSDAEKVCTGAANALGCPSRQRGPWRVPSRPAGGLEGHLPTTWALTPLAAAPARVGPLADAGHPQQRGAHAPGGA